MENVWVRCSSLEKKIKICYSVCFYTSIFTVSKCENKGKTKSSLHGTEEKQEEPLKPSYKTKQLTLFLVIKYLELVRFQTMQIPSELSIT